jgi:hypothetical protein
MVRTTSLNLQITVCEGVDIYNIYTGSNLLCTNVFLSFVALFPQWNKLRHLSPIILDERLDAAPRALHVGWFSASSVSDELSSHLGSGPLFIISPQSSVLLMVFSRLRAEYSSAVSLSPLGPRPTPDGAGTGGMA